MAKIPAQTYLDPRLKERAEAIADRTDRSLSYLLEKGLARLVEEEERKA